MNVNPFVRVESLHRGEVAWWWSGDKLDDAEYRVKVCASVEAKVQALERKFGVAEDKMYLPKQREGRCFIGDDKELVERAAEALGRHLQRFPGVVPARAS